MIDIGRSSYFVKEQGQSHAVTEICGTYVEGCELNPVVFQISERETEVWIEGVCHELLTSLGVKNELKGR